MMGTHHGKAAKKGEEAVDTHEPAAHTPNQSVNLPRLPIEQPATPLDDNLWKLIIGSYIGPDDFRSVLFTCRYWGYYYGRDEHLREQVIANRTEITTIIYTDSNCSEISKKEVQPARAPEEWGKVVKVKQWEFAENYERSSFYNYIYEAIILGSTKKIKLSLRPGRGHTAELRFGDLDGSDPEGVIDEFTYFATDNGRITFGHSRTSPTEALDPIDMAREETKATADRILVELGITPSKHNWMKFLGRIYWFVMVYYPPFLDGSEELRMGYHWSSISKWVDAGMPDEWQD